jgi:hypothetical protein
VEDCIFAAERRSGPQEERDLARWLTGLQ